MNRCLGTKFSKCKYEFESFSKLISRGDIQSDTSHIILNTDIINPPPGLQLTGTHIAVHFKTTDQRIDQALTCDINEIFLNVEIKLKDVCDEIKNKQCYYIHNAEIIDKNKTLQQNRIHDGDKIIVNEITNNE